MANVVSSYLDMMRHLFKYHKNDALLEWRESMGWEGGLPKRMSDGDWVAYREVDMMFGQVAIFAHKWHGLYV